VIWLLAVWVGVASTVVLPFRRFITPDYKSVAGWTLAAAIALAWPWAVLMLVRKAFVVACIGGAKGQ
jgi:uncharacterized protein (DUF697 family)